MDAGAVSPRHPPPRLSHRALVGWVVVALGLGWLWWSASAPVAGAGSGATGPGPSAVAAVRAAALAQARPDTVAPGDAVFQLPVAGRVESRRGEAGAVVNADPTGHFVMRLDEEQLASLLPETDHEPILRQGMVLNGRGAAALVGPAPSGSFQLHVVCLGGGEANLELVLNESVQHYSLVCDGTTITLDLLYPTGYTSIMLSAGGSAATTIAFQLVRR